MYSLTQQVHALSPPFANGHCESRCALPLRRSLTPFARLKGRFRHLTRHPHLPGAIGRRYRRMDEVGTPFCITVDFDTLEDDTVTIRERDTTEQRRVTVPELLEYLEEQIEA